MSAIMCEHVPASCVLVFLYCGPKLCYQVVTLFVCVTTYSTSHTHSPFALPGSSHPGSVATTPAPTSDNTGGFLRPGTTALLQATVCQESEGMFEN